MATTQEKEQLHHLVDQLPDAEVHAAAAFLQFLLADPVWRSIIAAPADDEPYTDEQKREDAEARAAIARGEGVPHDEVLRRFGLR